MSTVRRMNALVISASLPPFNDSSTLQVVDRLRRFAPNDLHPVCVGADMPEGVETTLQESLPRGSEIIRTGATPYDRTMHRLQRVPGRRVLRWVLANVAYRLAVPDVRAGWDSMVVQRCGALPAEQRPDVIVSSGGSHTAHMAGVRLAARYGVPWVADLGDPWSFLDEEDRLGWLRARRNRRLEESTLLYASGLVFSTEATLQAYRERYGERLPPAVALPCYGFVPEDFAWNAMPTVSGPLEVAHIGTAHSSNRNLVPTLEAIATLREHGGLRHGHRLSVVGTHSLAFETQATRLGLQDTRFTGRVSYGESVQWMERSHVLLLIGNAGPLQIPGKVYPYLGAPRPILYVGQRPPDSDPAVAVLRAHEGVYFAENTADSLREQLAQLDCDFQRAQRAAMARQRSTCLAALTSSAVSQQFVNFVLSVCAPTRRDALAPSHPSNLR
jgi:hypothetical protein